MGTKFGNRKGSGVWEIRSGVDRGEGPKIMDVLFEWPSKKKRMYKRKFNHNFFQHNLHYKVLTAHIFKNNNTELHRNPKYLMGD